jgi:hypothetical protein
MNYCQNKKCHEYTTKDRIRGTKGNKFYQTRRRKYLLFELFCSQNCLSDWIIQFGEQAVNYFGRTTEASKRPIKE